MLKSILGIYVAASVGCNNFNPSECGCEATNQADYRGTINITSSGLTCQNWDTQYPNKHDFKPGSPEYRDMDLRENYCRNPDGSKAPWCITTTLSRDWCDIPICDERTATRNLSVKNQKDGGYGSVRNSISIKSQSDGVYRSDNTYYNISAKGKTSEPLSEGDYISVKLDGRWVKTKFTQDGSWKFTNSTERKVGIKTEAEIAVFGSEGDVVSYKKLYFDGSKAQHIITIEKSYIKNRVAAKGKTNSPLRDGDKIKVYIGSKWSDINFNSKGRWNFDTTVTTGFTEVLVGIFNRKDVRLTYKRIFLEGSVNENGNEIYIKGSHHGQSLSNTTYTNLQVYGIIKKPLEPSQSLAVKVGGKWIRCHVYKANEQDGETYWYWVDKKVRTKGENLKIVLGLFDGQSQLILKSDSLIIDGSLATELINVDQGQGRRLSDSTYGDTKVTGQLGRALASDEKLVSYAGKEYRKIKVNDDNTWEITYDTVKKVGDVFDTYIQLSSSVTNQIITEYIAFTDGSAAKNELALIGTYPGQYIDEVNYTGFAVNGTLAHSVTPGQYVACKIGGFNWMRTQLVEQNGKHYWRCGDWIERFTKQEDDISIGIFEDGLLVGDLLYTKVSGYGSNKITASVQGDDIKGRLSWSAKKDHLVTWNTSITWNYYNSKLDKDLRSFDFNVTGARGTSVQTKGEFAHLSYFARGPGPFGTFENELAYLDLYYGK